MPAEDAAHIQPHAVSGLMSQGGSGRLVFRTPLWHRLAGVAGLLLGSVAAFAAAVTFSGIVRPLGVVIGLALVVVGCQFWRLRVEADDEGILVVDWRGRKKTPWAAIQRFSWDVGLQVLMRDGTSLSPDVFSPMVTPVTGQLDDLRAVTGRRLQDELQRRRHQK